MKTDVLCSVSFWVAREEKKYIIDFESDYEPWRQVVYDACNVVIATCVALRLNGINKFAECHLTESGVNFVTNDLECHEAVKHACDLAVAMTKMHNKLCATHNAEEMNNENRG